MTYITVAGSFRLYDPNATVRDYRSGGWADFVKTEGRGMQSANVKEDVCILAKDSGRRQGMRKRTQVYRVFGRQAARA
ncbi:hypothetical protein NDU88_005775 [Pleurodeles waltl]|uniref:Uncharacterized protein n=1 Tax=Pleurodeles waltl TaxID=8319 RepID=A0AAV7TCX4_PLEWA|nr:hypothetical protein NDU88_005775 [Pleurodeles waltl]